MEAYFILIGMIRARKMEIILLLLAFTLGYAFYKLLDLVLFLEKINPNIISLMMTPEFTNKEFQRQIRLGLMPVIIDRGS